jgi:hypothetical protein
VLLPVRGICDELVKLRTAHAAAVDRIRMAELYASVKREVFELFRMMVEAIDLRYAINTRGAAVDDVARNRQFFEKIEILAQKGLDVRSRTWNVLVSVRFYSAHRDTPILKANLGRAFQARYNGSPEVALEALWIGFWL